MSGQALLDRLARVMEEALFINPPKLIEEPRKDQAVQVDGLDWLNPLVYNYDTSPSPSDDAETADSFFDWIKQDY